MARPLTTRSFFKFLRQAVLCPTLVTATVALGYSAERLSLDAVLRQALANNRDLSAASLGPEIARGQVEQSALKPNPSLDVGAQSDLITGNTGARKFGVGISQAIPLGNRLQESQSVARTGVTLAEDDLANRQRLLLGEVSRAYLDLLVLVQQVSLRDRLIASSTRLVELSDARAKRGEVSLIEVNAARLDLAKVEQERATLHAEQVSQLQRLKPLLGLSPDDPLEISDDLDAVISRLANTADAEKSNWNRADLRLANASFERIGAEQRLAHAEARGDLTVGATYDYERDTVGDSAHFLGVKLSIPLPLKNKNQGKLRELRADRTRAQRETEALELSIASEVAVARQRAAQFKEIITGYQTTVLPLGLAAENNLNAAYQQGQVPMVQVIQSQQQRLALEAGALEAKATYARALAELQTATGSNPQLASVASDNSQR